MNMKGVMCTVILLLAATLLVLPVSGAFNVTGINPDRGNNTALPVLVDITGNDLPNQVIVKLVNLSLSSNITASSAIWIDSTRIVSVFDLNGKVAGERAVVVVNKSDGSEAVLEGTPFLVENLPPTVSSVTPNSGINTQDSVDLTVKGSDFRDGDLKVTLTKESTTPISAEGVSWVSSGEITCKVNVSGAAAGKWSVEVTNPDGKTGALDEGFTVWNPAPTVTKITPSGDSNNKPVVSCTVEGTGFIVGASVNLSMAGQPDIKGYIAIVTLTAISCSFDLTDVQVGAWDVVVTNEDGQSGTLPAAFLITYPVAPVVDAIEPATGVNSGIVTITNLSGTGFEEGATVVFTKDLATIAAENVIVNSPVNITCSVNLTGRALGQWNLIVVNPDGKTGGLRNAFRITTAPPVPEFTASPTYGTVPLTVQFTDLSTNYPYIWSWNFGDGSIVTGINQANPVHVYNTPGVYNVTLYALNSDGVGEKITKSSYITVVETPVAHFTATPMSGPAPLFVQFTDTSDGDPYRWVWKFGDGQISDQKNPYFLYKNPGLYQVELTVYNKAGSDTATKTIEVLVSPPDAEFTANRTAGDSPLTVRFTDLSTGAPTTWAWKFGDSGSSEEQNPVYVFSNPGTYGVQLTASNAAGTSTETKNGYIVVGQTIKADFNFTPSNEGQTAPLSVAFSDLSSGNVLKWNWNFGDAHISTERNPIHTYASPGTYTITLSVLGLTGSDSVTKTITVVAPLIADFIAEPTTGSAPLTIVLSDRSTGDVATREWVIMDNPEEYAKNIVYFSEGQGDQMYTLTEPGLYTVRLTIRDADGKPDSKIKTNYINVLPFP